MKLALGTAQFGLNYGAFNQTGQVKLPEVAAILDMAKARGIDTLDTARAYGTSEDNLGELRAAERFRIVTKIASLSGHANPAVGVSESIEASQRALATDRLDALLFHAAEDLLGTCGDLVWAAAETWRCQGLVEKLGVSVYTPAQADTLLARYDVKIIQVPMSVFDQRFAREGVLDRCAEAGVEVHTRSAFLQGFVLADPVALSPRFEPWRKLLQRFASAASAHRVSRLSAALAPMIADERIARVIVGCENVAQLAEIADAGGKTSLPDFGDFACTDEGLINPAKWSCSTERSPA